MSIRIKHPEFKAGREKAIGLEFIDGYAEVESLADETRAALLQHGFEIVEGEAVKPLEKFTKKQLIQYAIEHNIVVDEKASRDAILATILAPATESAPVVEAPVAEVLDSPEVGVE